MGALSILGEAGILGAFREGLEIEVPSWARAAGVIIPSDSLVENHRWLGQVPQLREYTGSTVSQAMRARGLSVENKPYDASITLDRDDMRRDKTGQMLEKVGEFGTRTASHWDKIGTTDGLLGTDLGWDGVSLFSAAHVDGKAGTQSNLLTSAEVAALNVATATAPTKQEAVDILLGLATRFYSLLDDQGEPANATVRQIGLVCPNGLYAIFVAAAADLLGSNGGTNEVTNQRFSYMIFHEARLTVQTVVYPFAADGVSRGLILQSELEPDVEVDDTLWVRKRELLVKAFASRRVAPGNWRKIAQATLS